MTESQTIPGTVCAVFGHRFAIESQNGRHLADLGPKGAEGIPVAVGDRVSITGERKPSEIKVSTLTLHDGTIRTIAWPRKPHEDSDRTPANPAAVLAAVEAHGYVPEGEVRRKPKHFEIACSKDGSHYQIHVALDGRVRHAKVIVGAEPRTSSPLATAAS